MGEPDMTDDAPTNAEEIALAAVRSVRTDGPGLAYANALIAQGGSNLTSADVIIALASFIAGWVETIAETEDEPAEDVLEAIFITTLSARHSNEVQH